MFCPATTPPSAAPTIAPTLYMEWSRDIIETPIAFSTSTPWAFIATSMDPAWAPKTKSSAARDSASYANESSTSDRQSPIVLHSVTHFDVYRSTRRPHMGMASTDPAAVPSSTSPRTELLSPSSICTVGIREIHVDTASPWTRKIKIELHHADRIQFEKPC